MAILSNLRNTILLSLVLAALMLFAYGTHSPSGFNEPYWQAFFRWVHVFFGILWIGLLYYFNFVQIPSMPKIPDEQKPAIGKVIAPTALFWFRWGAMATIITGLILANMYPGYFVRAISLQAPNTAIGIGMWLGLIMWFNVWFIIWPNQKKALGIVTVTPEEKAAAAKLAGMTSRINTMLSLPMLYCMAAQSHGGF